MEPRLATHDLDARVARAAATVQSHNVLPPRVAITLGSGLSAIAEAAEGALVIQTADLPDWPRSTVSGHAGRLVIGRWRQVPVIVLAGRTHRYEGYPLDRATFGVRVAHALGARTFLFTNAAGGIAASLSPGDLMLATDHINFVGKRGLFTREELKARQSGRAVGSIHAPELRAALMAAAEEAAVPLHLGVLFATHGPSYETAAEIRWAMAMGASAVCMSTVHEATVAAHLGGSAASLSMITNRATGLDPSPLSHEEVMVKAAEASGRLRAVIERFLDREHAGQKRG
jgi:purine-nucleoside phosphorylase